ncbi:MAG: hypothetical protein AB7P07_11265 [Hyphomonadaceae bacterium]
MIELIFIGVFQAASGDPQAELSPFDVPVMAQPVAAADRLSAQERRQRHAIRCRDRIVVGSRIGHRVCYSRADEEQWQRDSQDIAHRMHRGAQQQGGIGPTGP